MTFELFHSECLEKLKTLEDNSIDSIVTDPPYGLSFMGRKWDYDVPSVDIWCECLRVLKPGGHLLAFAGTRTQHRMCVNIEDAGFEIRDMIAWCYGSGFPKSMNMGKAIDKARVEDKEPTRVVCRFIRAAMDAQGLKSRHLTQHFGGCNARLIDHWAARDTDSQPNLPTWEQYLKLKEVLGLSDEMDAEVWRLEGRKGQPGDAHQNAEVIGEHTGATPGFGEHRFSSRDRLIRELSPEAQQWEGWGTALKPALEPITVARKPFKGTVAQNVLEHGTGGINIDGCRVGTTRRTPASLSTCKTKNAYGDFGGGAEKELDPNMGRWPANLIHDGSDDVVELFPQSVSTGGSGPASRQHKSDGRTVSGSCAATGGFGDSGSAARFFYCAKASKADRGDGNTHPTVKPTALMRYLCRLVTPPGGVVLDPFMGSGSTGKAAMLEGFDFIGIEMDEEYVNISKMRIEAAAKETK